MTVKVKMRGNLKATVKFKNQAEEQWFSTQMVIMRDSDPKMHPQMIVRDTDGFHVPKIPKPMQLKPEVPEDVKPSVVTDVKTTKPPKK